MEGGGGLKICFWNVAGLLNKYEKTWDYLEKFDILGLTETWVDTERWQSIENKLSKDHLRKCTPAEKEHRKGRAKGGIIVAVKKNLKEVKIRELNKETTEINLKYNENRWRIITSYSRKIEDTIGSLLEYIQEEDLLMKRDFNARTGNKGEGGPIRKEKEEDKSEIQRQSEKQRRAHTDK